jgi:hypothetical protein
MYHRILVYFILAAVSIHIRVTGITDTIPVNICLSGVAYCYAVVAGVTYPVPVGVFLVGIITAYAIIINITHTVSFRIKTTFPPGMYTFIAYPMRTVGGTIVGNMFDHVVLAIILRQDVAIAAILRRNKGKRLAC